MVELQQYTTEEVAKHNTDESTWIILDNKVYDVTKFLLEHPGGDEVILEYAGTDATVGFNDVGHSSDARKLAEDYLIGVMPKKDTPLAAKPEKTNESTWGGIICSLTWTNFLIPVAISLCVLVTYKVAHRIASNM